jgi:hypothetical protein
MACLMAAPPARRRPRVCSKRIVVNARQLRATREPGRLSLLPYLTVKLVDHSVNRSPACDHSGGDVVDVFGGAVGGVLPVGEDLVQVDSAAVAADEVLAEGVAQCFRA